MQSRSLDPELCGCLVQATGHGIWEWDVVADVLAADARCHEVLGGAVPEGAASAGTYEGLVDLDCDEDRRLVFRAAAEAGGDFDYEYRLPYASGDWRWIRLRGFALTDDAGRVVRCVGLMRDVTEERKLRESEERLRLVVTGTHDGVWEFDARSGRLWSSDELLAMLGLARGGAPQDLAAAFALVHPDDLPAARRKFEEARSGRRTPIRGTARVRHSAGGWRRVEAWAVPVKDPEQTDVVTRIVGIVHDRTDAPAHGDLARILNNSVLHPIETAARHMKMAAVELSASPERAGDLIDVSSAHLSRVRDVVEDLILSSRTDRA
jgi:PAS domain S-box-containing protein